MRKVHDAGKQVEDASGQQKLHIVSFLESIRDRTWDDIKGAFAKCVLAYLTSKIIHS